MIRVRRAVKQGLYASGYFRLRLKQSGLPGVAVLCFHGVRGTAAEDVPFRDLHVTRATLESVCRAISECCTPIDLEALRNAHRGRVELPPRAVLVTFDDGYRGVLEHALPVLERYRIPAAVFVCTTPVEERRALWFDAVCRQSGEDAVFNARRGSIDAWRALVETSGSQSPAGELHRPLTVDELRELAASPLIEIGAHTMLHPTLAMASREEQQREIAGSRAALERLIGKPVTAFAYPYGEPGLDYNADSVTVAREAGFDLSFSTVQSFAAANVNPFEIPRFMMLDSIDGVELAHRLVHAWPASTE